MENPFNNQRKQREAIWRPVISLLYFAFVDGFHIDDPVTVPFFTLKKKRKKETEETETVKNSVN